MSIPSKHLPNSLAANVSSYTTNTFCGTPSGFVRRVGTMLLFRWWWAIAIPVAACCILAINEAVWLFVAMMLIFLLYPGLTMMVYFNYAFSPEAQRTLYEQSVTISNKLITVSYIDKKTAISYSIDDVAGIEYGSKEILIKLKKPRYNHLAIPLSAIDNDDRQKVFDILAEFCPTVA
jgi:hypothetical protein